MIECWNARKRGHEEEDVLTNLPTNEANTVKRHEEAREENRRGAEQTRTRGRVHARENMAHIGTSDIFKCKF